MMNNFDGQSDQSEQLTVAGSGALPDHLVRIPEANCNGPQDTLNQRLHTLLSLHPEIDLNFRDEDLAKMDDSTKSILISDVQRVLKIAEFKADTL